MPLQVIYQVTLLLPHSVRCSFVLFSCSLFCRQSFFFVFDNQCFANEVEHNCDLRNAEEAPDAGLLHHVAREQAGEEGPRQVQDQSLHGHPTLVVERKERCEHEETVNSNALNVVRCVGQWNRPAQVPHDLALECANRGAAQPLAVGDDCVVPSADVGHWPAHEQKETSNQTKTLDDSVLVLVLLKLPAMFFRRRLLRFCGERFVDDVASPRLEANVKKPEDSQHFVDEGVTNGGIKSCCQEYVLDGLQQLHGEEVEHADSKPLVPRRALDPKGQPQAQ